MTTTEDRPSTPADPYVNDDTADRWRRYILDDISQAAGRLLAGTPTGVGVPDSDWLHGTGPRIPMAFGIRRMQDHAQTARDAYTRAVADNNPTWMLLLRAEAFAAMAELEWPQLRARLVDLAAVCTAWIETGDNRD